MKRSLRGGQNVCPTSACPQKLRQCPIFRIPRSSCLHVVLSLCVQPHNQIRTYFYFSLNCRQRCHKCQRQMDRFVLKLPRRRHLQPLPHSPFSEPDSGIRPLKVQFTPLSPGAFKKTAPAAGEVTHPFARQPTNIFSQRESGKSFPR